MRARLVIASDCEDLRVIRLLGLHIGATKVANEHLVSLVKLQEVHNWSDYDRLGEILREVLPENLPACLLLQGGNRPKAANDRILRHLSAPANSVRILSAAELENYLLDPTTVARVSGAASEMLAVQIAEIQSRLHESTRAAFLSEWMASLTKESAKEVLAEAEKTFEAMWSEPSLRGNLVRGTQMIKELNVWLGEQGYQPISAYRLAKAALPQSLPSELFNFLLEIDEAIS
jgi:hypothetical protein